VGGQEPAELGRDGELAPARLGLGFPEPAVSTELLGDGHRIAEQVERRDGKARDLGPAQAEHRSEPYHGLVAGIYRPRQGDDVLDG
jgi:hypothetical protein